MGLCTVLLMPNLSPWLMRLEVGLFLIVFIWNSLMIVCSHYCSLYIVPQPFFIIVIVKIDLLASVKAKWRNVVLWSLIAYKLSVHFLKEIFKVQTLFDGVRVVGRTSWVETRCSKIVRGGSRSCQVDGHPFDADIRACFCQIHMARQASHVRFVFIHCSPPISVGIESKLIA